MENIVQQYYYVLLHAVLQKCLLFLKMCYNNTYNRTFGKNARIYPRSTESKFQAQGKKLEKDQFFYR